MTKGEVSGILSKLSGRTARGAAEEEKKSAPSEKKGLTNPGECGKITKLSERPGRVRQAGKRF